MTKREMITRLQLAIDLVEENEIHSNPLLMAARNHIQDVLNDLAGANDPQNYCKGEPI